MRAVHWLGVVLITVLALGVRCYQLGSDSLWHDELWGIEMAVGHDATQVALPEDSILTQPPDLLSLDPATPWWEVWSHMHHDTHPPLFHLTLRLWEQRFGTGEAALRSLSVICSILALVVFFDAVRLHNGPTAALGAIALMAVASPAIQYAQEARSYALLLLEGLLAVNMLVRLERDGPKLWKSAVLCLCVVAMALTHYFAAGAIIAIALYALAGLRGSTRNHVLAALGVAGILGVALWGHPFWMQHRNFANSPLVDWLIEPNPHRILTLQARLILVCARFLFEPMGWAKVVSCVMTPMLLLPVLALRRSPQVLLWWLWLVCTVGLVAMIDLVQHTKHLAMIRYVLLAAPAVYALLATARDWMPLPTRRFATLVPAVALVITAAALPTHAYHAYWRPDWRGVAGVINHNRQPDEPVCLVGPGDAGLWGPDAIYIEMNYYLRPLTGPIGMILVPRPSPDQPAPAQLLGGHDRAWAIVTGEDGDWPPAGWSIDKSVPYQQIGFLQHLHREH